MALINCPECSKSISDGADHCPACGYVMNRKQTGGNSTRKTILIVCICLGLFGAIVGFTVGNPVFGAVGVAGVAIGAVKLAMMV